MSSGMMWVAYWGISLPTRTELIVTGSGVTTFRGGAGAYSSGSSVLGARCVCYCINLRTGTVVVLGSFFYEGGTDMLKITMVFLNDEVCLFTIYVSVLEGVLYRRLLLRYSAS